MFVQYTNGNYNVVINLDDGTKLRYHDGDTPFIPSRPESLDVKISNQCNHNCSFCHEDSRIDGKVATLGAMTNFVNSIPPYTEIAVGGGNLMESYIHTEVFLSMLKEVKAIPSITVRQDDFIKYFDIIQEWKDKHLIYGIGVSLTNASDYRLYRCMDKCPTAVLHVIAGLLTEQDYQMLAGSNIKMLILGYKKIRRGLKRFLSSSEEIHQNIVDLESHFDDFKNDFAIVSFDNLALEQLRMRAHVLPQDWNKYYMGDDGEYTFYVDLVEEKFAQSSTNLDRHKIDEMTVTEMFNVIRSNND